MGHGKQANTAPLTPEEHAELKHMDKQFNRFRHTDSAIFVMLIGHCLAVWITLSTCQWLGESAEPAFTAANTRVGIFLGLYFLVMLGVRYPQGTFVLYEMLWGYVVDASSSPLCRNMLICGWGRGAAATRQ
jgi:hypothetical protein